MNERTPPHSSEAEQSVLGALLQANEAFDVVGATLVAGDFYEARHRAIWAVLEASLMAGKPADVVSVFEKLESVDQLDLVGGIEYLHALAQGVASASNIARHASIVREKALHRKLIATIDDAAGISWEAGEVGEKVDRIGSLVGGLAVSHVKKMPRAIADIAIDRIQAYEDLADGKMVAGWRAHIPWLTNALNGGFRAGGLYILAARPSVGKSSFAQDLGMKFAEDGLTTLFLSQEMADTEVADRGVANTGRLSYSKLLTGKMGDEEWSRASEAMEKLGKLPFYIDDQPSLTLQDIRIKAKSCKGLKILILDYLQLCASSRKDGNRNSEIEELSRGLKTMAKELGIAVIALSQLNRNVETRAVKRPSLSDLRDSGAIEQDADVVMFLWFVREFESEGRRIIGLGIDKNRQGRLGQVGLDFIGDIQRWSESECDINPEPMARKSVKGFE